VRLNTGTNTPIEEAPFTISTANENGISFHTRIWARKNGGYSIALTIAGNTLTVANSSVRLEDFIKTVKNQQPDFLTQECPGWPYSLVFSPKHKLVRSGYDTDGTLPSKKLTENKEAPTNTITESTSSGEITQPQPPQKNLPPGTRACNWCGKPVFHAEEQLYDGAVYHVQCMNKYKRWATEEEWRPRNAMYLAHADVQPLYYRAPIAAEGLPARMETGTSYKKT